MHLYACYSSEWYSDFWVNAELLNVLKCIKSFGCSFWDIEALELQNEILIC